MPATALGQMELYRPGWRDPRRLDAANIIAAWQISAPGRLSAFFPATTRFPYGGDLKGMWVLYRHPTAGEWGGIIEDTPVDWGNGAVEVAAVDFAQTLAHRLAPDGYYQRAATAGELMTRALSDGRVDDPLAWEIAADEVPPYLDWAWRDDDLLSVATTLAQSTGQEWQVTVSARKVITFAWRQRLGRDRRRTVLLCEGYDVGGRLDDSITSLVNTIRAVANDERWANATRLTVEDAASIAQYGGRRWASRRYVDVGTKPTLEPKARADLAASASASITPEILLSHTDRRGLLMREGDTVRLWSAAQNKRLDVRIIGREVNTATGLLRVVGRGTAV